MKKKNNRLFRALINYTFIIAGSFLVCSCISNTVYVPVVDVNNTSIQKTYVVRVGDTLYSVAWAFGLDFRTLVELNHLAPPYAISVGQRLWLSSSSESHHSQQRNIGQRSTARHNRPVKFIVVSKSRPHKQSKVIVATHKSRKYWHTGHIRSWVMPARGQVINIFSTHYGATGKGLEIHGRTSEPIKAAASGTIVYSGDGLRSYGNLLLIKHNDEYLSAYAFNQKLFVKAGDWVKQGQKIAMMGEDSRGVPMLYFEIRRFGKPVNPMQYLHR